MAKAYKRFGIIKNDRTSCSKYFPVHFSTKSDNFLNLTKFTTISEEQNIIIGKNYPETIKIEGKTTPPASILEIQLPDLEDPEFMIATDDENLKTCEEDL